MIKVLFFAGLKEVAQTGSISIDAVGVNNVRELVVKLGQQLPPELLDALQDETAMVSVDQQYAGWDAELHDENEVGFLPPVSGG